METGAYSSVSINLSTSHFAGVIETYSYFHEVQTYKGSLGENLSHATPATCVLMSSICR